MDLTIAAVKSRLHRVRLYLRERLSRYLRGGGVHLTRADAEADNEHFDRKTTE